MKQADDILSILTFSEQRKGILFFLQEKPRTLTDIKEHFDVKSPNILPRLREMEAKNLIIREDGMYWLTSFGKVAAFYYKPFLDTLMAIEANEDFWNKHDISIIPKRLWYKIKNLKGCNVIKGEDFVFESHKNFIDCIAKSQHFRGATCIFFPEWIKLFSELSSQEREIEIIITKEIFEKIKREYATELKNGLKNPNAHLYICDLKIAFAVTDIFSTLSLFFKNGSYDSKNDLVGVDSSSIKWTEELFQHYKKISIEVDKKLINSIESLNEAVTQEQFSEILSI